ncbi:hypothetical protein O9929_06910 [Vibrio lentus]|nr:hypothetical protein [Vibrio lentus]
MNDTLRQHFVTKTLKCYYCADLLVETLAVAQAREWLLNTQISDFRYG